MSKKRGKKALVAGGKIHYIGYREGCGACSAAPPPKGASPKVCGRGAVS